MDQWLKGNEIDNIKEILESIAYLEFDCEMRTAKKMEDFADIFNVQVYIQKSNAYVAFYKILSETRIWYKPDVAPYLLDKIWKNMPTEFLSWDDYFKNYKFYHLNWKDCQ